MITATLLLFALLLGYVVAVGLLLAVTFAFRPAPDFIVSNSRIRPRFKLLQELLWLLCCIAGGIVASLVVGSTLPWLTALGLIAALNLVLWKNDVEVRQRGFEHQAAISIVTAIGVAIGFAIRAR